MTALAQGLRWRSRWREPRFAGLVVLWGGVAGWTLTLAAQPRALAGIHQDLAELARNLASGALMVAGVVTLAYWRLTGEPAMARRSLAILLLGASYPAAAAIGPLLGPAEGLPASAPSTRALFLLPILALLLPGGHWRGTSPARPVSLGSLVALGWFVGLGVGAVVVARRSMPDDALGVASRLICCLSLLAWLVLAYRAAREPGRRQVVSSPVTAFALLAVGEVFRLLAARGVGSAMGVAPGLDLAAASVLVVAAVGQLAAARRSEEEGQAELARAVGDLSTRLRDVQVAERTRLHDARSAVLGVIGASELLDASGDAEPDRLRRLITAELHRLEAVLDGCGREPIGDFGLAAAVETVVGSHRLACPGLVAELEDLAVVGRPDATATVVDNLLRNARRHAPGADVAVRTSRGDGFAELIVEDSGPGIPGPERELVLRPGVRGSTACGPGEGLGLASCVDAMQRQGGALRVMERPGGGTRVVLTLPRSA